MNALAFLSSNELLIVLLVALVLFGGSQLPKLARNLGRAHRELQRGIAEGAGEPDGSDDSSDEAS